MGREPRGVCGRDHRIALAVVSGQVSGYWRTTALLAAAVATGIGVAVPVMSLHDRLSLLPLRGGDLELVWRAGVRPPAATQQEAVDGLGGLLLGMSLGTLAIAVVTILTLSLAREAECSSEVSVRRAVGAGRRVLLRSAMLEGGVIALAGLAAGGVLGAIVAARMAQWPGLLGPGTIGPGVIAAVGLVAVVLAGVGFPVLFPRRRVGEAEAHRPAPLLPAAIQIGASLIALTAGALLARHAGGVMRGLTEAPAGGAVYPIAIPGTAPVERARRYAALLRSVPAGSKGYASLSSPGALLGLGPVGTVTTDCGRCSEGGLPLRWRVKPATHHLVSADTFQMLGVRVVEGRGITDRDGWDAPRVAVINRGLAAREFQNGQALGRGIRVVDDDDRWSTVVGVVDDPSAVGLGGPIQPRYTVDWFAAQLGLQGWAMLVVGAVGALALTRLWVASLLGELGLRRALGARPGQTVKYVLLRAAAVGAAGIAGGVWFGGAIWSVLPKLVAGLDPWDVGLVARFGIVLLGSVLLCALPPALRAARAAPASLLSAS
jgi:hypothetical protein